MREGGVSGFKLQVRSFRLGGIEVCACDYFVVMPAGRDARKQSLRRGV